MSDESLENKDIKEQEKIEVQAENQEQEAPEERNWKAFREERRRDREARKAAEDEAQKRKKEAEALKQAMDAILDKGNSKAEDFENQSSSDQDKIMKEMERLLDEREKKREEAKRKKELAELPMRLKREHPDFDQVVTDENIDYLDYKYPHIAEGLSYMPDGPEKWRNVYKAIKQFVPTTDKDQKKAEENAKKPRSMSSGIVNSADEAPVMLDDRRRMENWNRMQNIVKMV